VVTRSGVTVPEHDDLGAWLYLSTQCDGERARCQPRELLSHGKTKPPAAGLLGAIGSLDCSSRCQSTIRRSAATVRVHGCGV